MPRCALLATANRFFCSRMLSSGGLMLRQNKAQPLTCDGLQISSSGTIRCNCWIQPCKSFLSAPATHLRISWSCTRFGERIFAGLATGKRETTALRHLGKREHFVEASSSAQRLTQFQMKRTAPFLRETRIHWHAQSSTWDGSCRPADGTHALGTVEIRLGMASPYCAFAAPESISQSSITVLGNKRNKDENAEQNTDTKETQRALYGFRGDVEFSNITLTFGSPGSKHFGTEPLPGVVRYVRKQR